MASTAQLTPMMAQYRRIKSELPKDALLLFRLGDFYEMFFEDAQMGAQLLNVALTKRGVVPMCGIPFHAANAYIGRILRAGRKVAICDQMEDARPGQLVKREVTQILSPGTHFDERMLKAERNNYLGAVYPAGRTFGLAFADLTTGDFMTTEVEGDVELLTELQRLRPVELLYPVEAGAVKELLLGGTRGSGEPRKPLPRLRRDTFRCRSLLWKTRSWRRHGMPWVTKQLALFFGSAPTTTAWLRTSPSNLHHLFFITIRK